MIVGASGIRAINSANVAVDVGEADLAVHAGIAGTVGAGLTAQTIGGITAFATGGQTSATALTGRYNLVATCATAADSVKLVVPPAAGLVVQTVKNGGAAALAVFPGTSGTINGGSANASVTIPVGGELTFYSTSGTAWNTVTAPTALAGIPPAGALTAAPNTVHTLGSKPLVSTDGTDYTIVVTEVIVAEVFIPCNMTLTGVAVFNGSTTTGGSNVKVGLFNSAGVLVATSASTAASGTDGYQLVPFTATYAAIGPGTYYVGLIGDTGTSKINTHTMGAGLAAKQTGQVYATGFTTIAALIATQRAAATPFITALGPMATLY